MGTKIAPEKNESIQKEPAAKKPAGKAIIKKSATTIEKKPDKPIEVTNLIKMAMDKDNGLEIIKELVALQNQQEDRQCKKEFDFHFAEMQKELKPVSRSKQGYKFKYAPIELLLEENGPIIAKHGFSYHWEKDPGGIEKQGKYFEREYIVINGYGHTQKETYFDVPDIEATELQNAIQVEGVKNTYAHRYTLKAGFGIVEIDEDTDGEYKFDEVTKYYDQIQQIEVCDSEESANCVAHALYKELRKKGDVAGQKIIRKAYGKRKAEIQAKGGK